MQAWGILSLADPLTGEIPVEAAHASETVRFAAGEGLLTQAQSAYQRLRGRCERVCVAAAGSACGVAASLASQLPAELLALLRGNVFGSRTGAREVDRMNAFARRNLPLISAEILLVDPSSAEERGFVRHAGLQTRKITCDFSGNVYNTICEIITR